MSGRKAQGIPASARTAMPDRLRSLRAPGNAPARKKFKPNVKASARPPAEAPAAAPRGTGRGPAASGRVSPAATPAATPGGSGRERGDRRSASYRPPRVDKDVKPPPTAASAAPSANPRAIAVPTAVAQPASRTPQEQAALVASLPGGPSAARTASAPARPQFYDAFEDELLHGAMEWPPRFEDPPETRRRGAPKSDAVHPIHLPLREADDPIGGMLSALAAPDAETGEVLPPAVAAADVDPACCGRDFAEDGGEWNGRLALFQLPTHLPWKPEHKPKTKTKTHAAPAAGGDGFTPASVADQRDDPDQYMKQWRQVKQGHAGRMRVFRSGKVVIEVGDIVWEVTAGVPPRHAAGVVVADPDEKVWKTLGNCDRKYVLAPSMDALLPRWLAERAAAELQDVGAGEEEEEEEEEEGDDLEGDDELEVKKEKVETAEAVDDDDEVEEVKEPAAQGEEEVAMEDDQEEEEEEGGGGGSKTKETKKRKKKKGESIEEEEAPPKPKKQKKKKRSKN